MVADSVANDWARDTPERARDHLLGLQHAEGWWQGELETNVTMDAEDLLLREFLGLRDDAVVAAAGRRGRAPPRRGGRRGQLCRRPRPLAPQGRGLPGPAAGRRRAGRAAHEAGL